MRPLIGCRLDLTDAPSLLAYPLDRDGYGRLSRLLSLGKMRADKGECELSLADVAGHRRASPSSPGRRRSRLCSKAELPRLREALPSLRHVAASYLYRGDDKARIERLDRIAQRPMAATILATNDVHYHAPDRRPLQDVMTCIREKVTIANAGYLLNPNAERHLKIAGRDGAAVRALAARHRRDARICRQRSTSASTSCATNIRSETVPDGRSPQQYLEHLTWEGATGAGPTGIPDKV